MNGEESNPFFELFGVQHVVQQVIVKKACETCAYSSSQNDNEICCRRRAPTTIVWKEEKPYAVFPLVSHLDWCGEWERRL